MSRFPFLLLVCAAAARASEPVAVVDGPRGQVSVSLFAAEGQEFPVARIEEETVTLRQFADALASTHAVHGGDEKAGKTDFRPILDRLIGARLIALEAHEMGLDDAPALQTAMAEFSVLELRREMLRELLRDVRPDSARADLYYREAVREWKLDSLLFTQEEPARAFAAAVKQGQEFSSLAAKAPATRTESGYVGAAKMLPQVLAAAQGLFEGQVSDPVRVEGGWAVFRVAGIRYPENPAARAEAQDRADSEARQATMRVVYPKLLAKHARVNKKLLARLDFEAKKPGFASLSKDRRVLAAIRGGTDITVADLAREISRAFFHGMDDAIRQKRVNEAKDRAFENLLRGAVLGAEAASRKLALTDAYREAVADHRAGLVFDEFVRRVILPGLEVKEPEGRAFYDAHKADYTLPAFYTVDDLSFAKGDSARSAAAKLRAGTDFKWLETNAEGRSGASTGATVSAASLPESARGDFARSRPGDVEVFEVDGQHHVSIVRRITPGTARPYLEVRAEIARKLTGEKVNRALAEWVAKLRERHQVEIYLRRIGS